MNDDIMKEFFQMVSQKLTEPDGEPAKRVPRGEVTAKDILLDFKLFVNELYEGRAEEDGDALIIFLNNGQCFRVFVKESKLQFLDN